MLHGENNKVIGLNGGREDVFTHVMVGRDDLIKHCADPARITFDDQQRRNWINEQSMMSADEAHKIYKNHRRYCGTKLPEFRKEWQVARGTKRGRPRKSTIK